VVPVQFRPYDQRYQTLTLICRAVRIRWRIDAEDLDFAQRFTAWAWLNDMDAFNTQTFGVPTCSPQFFKPCFGIKSLIYNRGVCATIGHTIPFLVFLPWRST
jgi:hypothetical protein